MTKTNKIHIEDPHTIFPSYYDSPGIRAFLNILNNLALDTLSRINDFKIYNGNRFLNKHPSTFNLNLELQSSLQYAFKVIERWPTLIDVAEKNRFGFDKKLGDLILGDACLMHNMVLIEVYFEDLDEYKRSNLDKIRLKIQDIMINYPTNYKIDFKIKSAPQNSLGNMYLYKTT